MKGKTAFSEVKKNFGFGCMRLPMNGGEVDYAQTCRMADMFLDEGFNYFDTAHGYIEEKSEIAVRECLVKRYPREKFVLANKLSGSYFDSNGQIRPLFEKQLAACGVDYFDFYLMHAQTAALFEKFKRCKAYETAFRLKEEGKVGHVGLSFHDRAEVLDEILTEYSDIEFVQIQFNYADFDDACIQSGKCYDVCRKHGKPIIVMEPVKGGTLVNLPERAARILSKNTSQSSAAFAIRYAASFDGIFMVLSGMSNTEQMKDNLSAMKDFEKMSAAEFETVSQIRQILKERDIISCTACRYCTDGCPKKISIPDLFSCMNAKKQFNDWNSAYYYGVFTKNGGKASDCIACGKCESACPQHLPIRGLLKSVAEQFDCGEPETGD